MASLAVKITDSPFAIDIPTLVSDRGIDAMNAVLSVHRSGVLGGIEVREDIENKLISIGLAYVIPYINER